jgi:hypothetical protein
MLVGLKENVILGHLVPTGTGYKPYHQMLTRKEEIETTGDKIEEKDELLSTLSN